MDLNVTIERKVLCGRSSSRVRRVMASLSAVSAICARRTDLIVVVSLHAPHMHLLARRVSRRRKVLVDLCDSPFLSRAAARDGDQPWMKRVLYYLDALLASSSSEIAYYSFISERDRLDFAARGTPRGRSVVIRPAVDSALGSIPPITGAIERVVIPADLRAPHNAEGFSWIMGALEAIGHLPPIHVYGPRPVSLTIPDWCEHRGWADDIREVYWGNTLVIAPNLRAMGLQNKVMEAVASGRPVLVGAEAAGELTRHPLVHTFCDGDEFRTKLVGLLGAPATLQGDSPDWRGPLFEPIELVD